MNNNTNLGRPTMRRDTPTIGPQLFSEREMLARMDEAEFREVT